MLTYFQWYLMLVCTALLFASGLSLAVRRAPRAPSKTITPQDRRIARLSLVGMGFFTLGGIGVGVYAYWMDTVLMPQLRQLRVPIRYPGFLEDWMALAWALLLVAATVFYFVQFALSVLHALHE